jgi:plastocyanin
MEVALAALAVGCSAFLPEVGPSRASVVDAGDGGTAVGAAPVDAALGGASGGSLDAAASSSSASLLEAGGEGAAEAAGNAPEAAPPDAAPPGTAPETGASAEAGGRAWTVTVGANGEAAFAPSTLTISAGDVVRWEWQTSGHTVVSGAGGSADGRFCSPSDTRCQSSPPSNAGDVYEHRFPAPGDYPYFCTQHQGMMGLVSVR